jgi:microcystin-dependent protein
MDFLLGGIILFSGNFAPQTWLPCDGRLLEIAQDTALFSIMGTTYGGDGTKTFALPKLASPVEGMTYIICVRGIYPQRS